MNIRFQFMKYRKIAGIASMIIFAISILSLSFRGLSLGLDFSGGTLVEVTYESPVKLESIRNTLIANGYEDSQVVNFGTNLASGPPENETTRNLAQDAPNDISFGLI